MGDHKSKQDRGTYSQHTRPSAEKTQKPSRDDEKSFTIRAVGSSEQPFKSSLPDDDGTATSEERRAGAERVDLSLEEKRRFIAMRRIVQSSDAYAILDVVAQL